MSDLVLAPDPTVHDRAVLAALPAAGEPGVRLESFPADRHLTLTGLRHLGLAQSRGGWWTRTLKGDALLAPAPRTESLL